jgi:hypothetical protein
VIDPGVGHDVGVDEDDVSHGDEGRQARQQLGSNGGAMQAQLEDAFKQPGTWPTFEISGFDLSGIQRRGFGFATFHSEFLGTFLLFFSEPVTAP